MSDAELKIAIQGVRASFHDVASRKFFPNQNIVPVECPSFRILCESLSSKRANFALMAIENTIAGSILPNYALLETNDFKILGEVYLRIELCFLALPNQNISDIRFVQSHPMAILQCQNFLSTLTDIKIVEAADTAESAFEIKTRNLKGYAAIANRLAAETYGLSILKENIETDCLNFTRFLVLGRSNESKSVSGANKTSIRFETAHKPGSLVEVLELFNKNGLNMTKIQSIPILGKPYQYAFHVDLEWDNAEKYAESMQALQKIALNVAHFGDYRSGEKYPT